MGIRKFCVCDQCDRTITDEREGYIIQGNIYVANPSDRGGLVGNNFPDPSVTLARFGIDDVRESVFCRGCLAEVLGLDARKGD